MRHAKGLQGIRKFTAENRAGWHVWIDGEYTRYHEETVSQIAEKYPTTILVGWTGNGLSLETA